MMYITRRYIRHEEPVERQEKSHDARQRHKYILANKTSRFKRLNNILTEIFAGIGSREGGQRNVNGNGQAPLRPIIHVATENHTTKEAILPCPQCQQEDRQRRE